MKPIERRSLWTPSSRTAQGMLEMWVVRDTPSAADARKDIMSKDVAAITPQIHLSPPTPQKFELRLVIWSARNVGLTIIDLTNRSFSKTMSPRTYLCLRLLMMIAR